MVGVCITCLSTEIPAHNLSKQPEVLGVDGAVFVTLNGPKLSAPLSNQEGQTCAAFG